MTTQEVFILCKEHLMSEALAQVGSVDVDTVKVPKVDDRTAQQLPDPKGYRILIALPEVEEKTEGGIIKAVSTMQVEETGSIVGFVMKIGPDAYADEKRFPTGPYCKQGDFVMMRAYSGTRFKIHGKEFRLINDDSVEGVVQDPRGITKL